MIYTFGDCELDTKRRELRVGSELRSMEPQVFDLLHYLIERHDRMVSKDELFETIWNGRVVSDANLSNRVKLARRAINDDGRRQELIRTFPRRGFRFVGELSQNLQDRSSAPRTTSVSPNGAQERSAAIAVLPFNNPGADPAQNYFSEGLAEDLITDLSKIRGLYVAARRLSFTYRGQSANPVEAATHLGVRFILEGSVRRMGDRLRINTQLIDGVDGATLWAERYDGEMTEVFDFQDRIREEIIAALKLQLTPDEKASTQRRQTDSIEAYDLYLRGRERYFRYTPETHVEAVKCFEQAIELDPGFAEAYGYLSYCLFGGRHFRWMEPDVEREIAMGERAVELAPQSTMAHIRLGWVLGFQGRFEESIEHFETAISLEPDLAEIYCYYGEVLNVAGDFERGLAYCEKSLQLTSLAPPTWPYHVAHSYIELGQVEKAAGILHAVCRQVPKFPPARIYLIWALVELDEIDDAKSNVKALLDCARGYTVSVAAKNFPFRNKNSHKRLLAALRKAGLPES